MMEREPKKTPTPLVVEKNDSRARWIILLLACIMIVGLYYCYDIPAATKNRMDQYMGYESDFEVYFGLLYTLYAAPNVVLPFFGGYLSDRYGVRSCLLVFSILIAAGQSIFALGLSVRSWPIMFLGRLVFGFGGESFVVTNSALIVQWFKGKELAFAFGMTISFCRAAAVTNNVLSPALTKDVDLLFAVWFGAIICAVCVGCVLITIPIDLEMEIVIQHHRDQAASQRIVSPVADNSSAVSGTVNPLMTSSTAATDLTSPAAPAAEAKPAPTINLSHIFKLKKIFWLLVISCMLVYGCIFPFNNISSSLLLERDYFKDVPSGCAISDPRYCENDLTNPYTAACPSSKWVQPPLPNNATVSGDVYSPLQTSDIDCNDDSWKDSCATSLYCDRLNKAESQVSVIMSIPYIISACLSPFLGFLVDNIGLRAVIMTVSPMILIIVHLFIGLTDVDPIGPLVGQGLAYTFFAVVLWPSIPLVVKDMRTGIGYGVMTSALNLATAVTPLIAAAIYSSANDQYIPSVEYLFAAMGVCGVINGLVLNVHDWQTGHRLNGPAYPENVTRCCLVPCGCVKRPHDEHAEHHDAESATKLLSAPLVDHCCPSVR